MGVCHYSNGIREINPMHHFDEAARTWDLDEAKIKRARAVASAMRELIHLKSGIRALEVGCGTGLLSFELYPILKEVVILDNSPGMIEVLQTKIASSGSTGMHPVLLDLTRDPPPIGQFDLIYSLMALHHVLPVRQFLSVLHDLLKPNGQLFITDLDEEDGSFHDGSSEVHHGFKRENLQSILSDLKFRGIAFQTIMTITKKVGSLDLQYSVFMMSAAK
jgi:2-polyprenyl-3-methyl-5-hydroxy-6-metoxy-1,4-benzoquinol methylase